MNSGKAFAISDFFQLLATCLRYPDEDLINALLEGAVAHDATLILFEMGVDEKICEQVASSFSKAVARIDVSEPLRSVKLDYTRLFTHPKQPLLTYYETTFRHKMKMGFPDVTEGIPSLFVSPAATDATAHYLRLGLKKEDTKSNEPSDYVVTELEFLAHAYLFLGMALEKDNASEAEKVWKEIESFCALHVFNWMPTFFLKLEELGDTYYGFLNSFWLAGSPMVGSR